jgi:hypothetical protein
MIQAFPVVWRLTDISGNANPEVPKVGNRMVNCQGEKAINC